MNEAAVEGVTLTTIHWIYLIGIIAVVAFMVMRRDVVLPSLVGIFVIGLVYTGSVIESVQALFSALLTAGTDLFDIILVIALMVAMLKSLQVMQADSLMVAPARKIMKTPTMSFWVIGIVMYLAAIFFWPTPATALVGTMLIPVALKSGLSPMGAAMSVNILGHGMALSGDLVIQGAPGITESAAGLEAGVMLPHLALLSITAGLVSAIVAFFMIRHEFNEPGVPYETDLISTEEVDPSEITGAKPRFFSIAVPIVLLVVIIAMVVMDIRGGGATALLGGTATVLLFLSTVASQGGAALEKVIEHLKEGFQFAIKIFSPVIPIAGFFFLGSDHIQTILDEEAPPLLMDLGTAFADVIPLNPIALGFGNLIVGMVSGLDGSGFSGLPLVGGLAEALGGPLGVDVAVAASIGQIGAIFTGGGTIIAWAFGLVATAGIAGVKPLDLARKNFVAVMCGLIVATILGIIIM